MYKVKDFLTTEFLDWFMEIFPQTTSMILNLTDEELKAESAKISSIVEILCALYRLTSHIDSPEAVDKFRLDVALKGLRSPYIERRLSGLGDINDFVEASACTCSSLRNNVPIRCNVSSGRHTRSDGQRFDLSDKNA